VTGARVDPRWRSFNRRFIGDVHRLLALGYADVRGQVRDDHEEEDITGLIVQAIKARQDLGQFTRYFVAETAPEQSNGRMGKRRRELDILMECSSGAPRPHFIFEAKRLRAPGHSIGEYVGEEGLLCFIRGYYASDCKVAGMVGYVQSHAPDRWSGELSRKFRTDTDGVLRAMGGPTRVAIDQDLQHEWRSEHIRDDGTPIRIYHVFLVCYQSS